MKTHVSRTQRLVLSAVVAMSPMLAHAGDGTGTNLGSYGQDVGASERVEAAGLLRVLSQEAANAACHIGNDIAADEARTMITEVNTKFDLTLDALELGNPTMNINGAERRQKTLQRIASVREAWGAMKDDMVSLLDDPQNAASLAVVTAENENLLEEAALLTNEIGGSYSNPAELLQTDVLLLDFTSRQAMQSQRMGKLACAIWSGDRSDETMKELTSTMGLYDATLSALINGMPAMGILAAPTPEISAGLKEASADWGAIKADLDVILASASVDDSVKQSLFSKVNDAMRDMDEIEALYVTYAKHKYIDKSASGSKALTD